MANGRGRAADFVVPGAADHDVARFARGIGFVGVGTCPDGSFVHVDVRERSYFWIDRSGPGHRSGNGGCCWMSLSAVTRPRWRAASDRLAGTRSEMTWADTSARSPATAVLLLEGEDEA